MPVWVEILRGTVAEHRDVAPGEVVEVQDGTARRLVFGGLARVVEPPGLDRPAAEQRKRTR